MERVTSWAPASGCWHFVTKLERTSPPFALVVLFAELLSTTSHALTTSPGREHQSISVLSSCARLISSISLKFDVYIYYNLLSFPFYCFHSSIRAGCCNTIVIFLPCSVFIIGRFYFREWRTWTAIHINKIFLLLSSFGKRTTRGNPSTTSHHTHSDASPRLLLRLLVVISSGQLKRNLYPQTNGLRRRATSLSCLPAAFIRRRCCWRNKIKRQICFSPIRENLSFFHSDFSRSLPFPRFCCYLKKAREWHNFSFFSRKTSIIKNPINMVSSNENLSVIIFFFSPRFSSFIFPATKSSSKTQFHRFFKSLFLFE